jgi:hypothetical protein
MTTHSTHFKPNLPMRQHLIRHLVLSALILATSVHAGEPPSKPQLQEEFLNWKFGMFISFHLATYHEREWANGYEDPATFAPDKLDCKQWAEVCKAVIRGFDSLLRLQS